MNDNNDDTTFPAEDAWDDEQTDTSTDKTPTLKLAPCKDCGDEPGLLAGRCGECAGKFMREAMNRALNSL